MRCPQCDSDNFPGEDYCQNCATDLRETDLFTTEGLGAKVLSDTVTNLDPPKPVVVNSDATVKDAIDLMKSRGHGSVIIVDEGKFKGIFTERDLLKRVISKGLEADSVSISKVMTKKVQSLKETDSIAFALNRMSVHSIRHIPIMRSGVPIGIISVRGMLKYLAEHTLEKA